jgi:hypothetical protein
MLCWRASGSQHVEGISCLSFVSSGSLALPSKHRKPLNQQCSVTSQKTGIITYTIVTTSEVTSFAMSPEMLCKAMQYNALLHVLLRWPYLQVQDQRKIGHAAKAKSHCNLRFTLLLALT